MTQTTLLGTKAEAYVQDHLRQQKYVILNQNWRNKFCEIDIVAKDRKTYVFVEVKYRRTSKQGGIESVISIDKVRRLRRAVDWWCSEHQINPQEVPIRIDVAYLSGEDSYELCYVQNAIGIDE